jgi:hypothetical protein
MGRRSSVVGVRSSPRRRIQPVWAKAARERCTPAGNPVANSRGLLGTAIDRASEKQPVERSQRGSAE